MMSTENLLLVPILRFPEFEGEWERKTLGEIAIKRIKKNKDNSIKNVFTNSATRGIVNQRDYFDKDIANQDNLLNYYLVEKDYFIYNPRISTYAPVGPISRNNIGLGVMSPLYSVFKIYKGNRDFFEIYFSTAKWYEYMESIANYGARADRMSITTGDFYLMPLPFPTLPEQKRIASLFNVLNQKLSQLKQKKNLLEQYKKGVMQQLFSQKLQFKDKDGNKFPGWTKKYGNEVFYSVSNKNHNSNLPILAITQEHGAIPRELIDYQISVTDKSVESYKVVEIGDYIISLRSFQGGIEYSTYKGICSPAYIILRPIMEIDRYFFKYYFKTENYIAELNKKLEGIRDGKMISYKYFSDIKLPLPCLEEQTKIANFLTVIDEKLSRTQTQIQKTEQYRKGLLQKMFC